jgi:hypothetical protein
MPKDEYSDLRRAYAAAAGVNVRTAQRHQKQKHPDWERFIGVRASEAVKSLEKTGVMDRAGVTALAECSPFKPDGRPAFADADEQGLSLPQKAELRAWSIYEETYAQWKECLGGGVTSNAVVATGIARELPKLREDYEKARGVRERWEIENRRLIPVHEFESFVGQFLLPLADLLRNLPVELPLIANPADPELARSRIIEWLRSKAEPQIKGMLEGSTEFLAA